jgi:glycosyl-4,4'-diaponeurosporenoate acyltransferase
MTLWMIIINTLFWLVVCFGTAYSVRVFPNSWYGSTCWFFKEKLFERKVYRTIRIAKWKDKLPEWGRLLNFEKKNLKKDINLEYIDRFILETCYAEIGHLGMAVLGFACIFVNPRSHALMALILAIINLVIQIPFILIQRYNRPRLLRIRSMFYRNSQ